MRLGGESSQTQSVRRPSQGRARAGMTRRRPVARGSMCMYYSYAYGTSVTCGYDRTRALYVLQYSYAYRRYVWLRRETPSQETRGAPRMYVHVDDVLFVCVPAFRLAAAVVHKNVLETGHACRVPAAPGLDGHTFRSMLRGRRRRPQRSHKKMQCRPSATAFRRTRTDR